MKNQIFIVILVSVIAIAAIFAGMKGILSPLPQTYQFQSIHEQPVDLYGTGIYKHMSSDVAVQGIAQDYVTVFIAVPLLLISLYYSLRNSLRGRFVLAGALLYFLVTYLFYLCMAMYNELFLVYALLLGCSFFGLLLTLLNFDLSNLTENFRSDKAASFAGNFLIVNAILIALLWLKVVVPPLLDGTIYPPQLEQYTTLIVQGLDLGLMLPLGLVSGILLIKKTNWGFLSGITYIIFLALLMTALTAKIIAMAGTGQNVIPVIIIIPLINLTAVISSILLIKGINSSKIS